MAPRFYEPTNPIDPANPVLPLLQLLQRVIDTAAQAAIQGGNPESLVREHYRNHRRQFDDVLRTIDQAFWLGDTTTTPVSVGTDHLAANSLAVPSGPQVGSGGAVSGNTVNRQQGVRPFESIEAELREQVQDMREELASRLTESEMRAIFREQLVGELTESQIEDIIDSLFTTTATHVPPSVHSTASRPAPRQPTVAANRLDPNLELAKHTDVSEGQINPTLLEETQDPAFNPDTASPKSRYLHNWNLVREEAGRIFLKIRNEIDNPHPVSVEGQSSRDAGVLEGTALTNESVGELRARDGPDGSQTQDEAMQQENQGRNG